MLYNETRISAGKVERSRPIIPTPLETWVVTLEICCGNPPPLVNYVTRIKVIMQCIFDGRKKVKVATNCLWPIG